MDQIDPVPSLSSTDLGAAYRFTAQEALLSRVRRHFGSGPEAYSSSSRERLRFPSRALIQAAMAMKYVGAYLMAVIGGNDAPSAADVKAILEAGGVAECVHKAVYEICPDPPPLKQVSLESLEAFTKDVAALLKVNADTACEENVDQDPEGALQAQPPTSKAALGVALAQLALQPHASRTMPRTPQANVITSPQ